MINFENVSKFKLDDISIHIQKGQVTGLIGDTGAGKTTLVKLASGLLLPDVGRVSVMEKNLFSIAADMEQNLVSLSQEFLS